MKEIEDLRLFYNREFAHLLFMYRNLMEKSHRKNEKIEIK